MKRVIFPVLGGIGNQLFQLSALVNLSPSYERIVDSNLFLDSPNFSKIRVNELQVPGAHTGYARGRFKPCTEGFSDFAEADQANG